MVSSLQLRLDAVPHDRLIGSYSGGEPGPLVIAVGGIHGNEPSGPRAIESVIDKLKRQRPPISGAVVGLAGNLKALAENQRYIDEDLNRCFCSERLAQEHSPPPESSEETELRALSDSIHELAMAFEDICFIDCHTTSSESIPYLSVNAHVESLRLAERYPLYSVIGLEESIPGCFGEYANKLGYRGFTFEAGQHEDLASVENHEAAIWLLLAFSGAICRSDLPGFDHYEQMLARNIVEGRRTFRLGAHYKIDKGEEFVMQPGYVNFQSISKGELLARNRFGDIRSPCDGRILMPLYQKEGDDGFFILEEE